MTMFLTALNNTAINEAVQESTTHGFDLNVLIGLAMCVAVVFIVIGVIKKTLSMCIIAFVIAAFLGITTPDSVTAIKDKIVSVFDGAIEPFKDEDYSDLIGDDIFNNLGDNFEDIGKENDKSENNDK